MKRSQTIVLTPKLFEEFSKLLENIENSCGVVRESIDSKHGNQLTMNGNTYIITYKGVGKYKTFCKKLKEVWQEFNSLYPNTTWKGK